ncbi:MAG TPA: hypothetical protein VFC07_11090 [Verrucomicrobiae bacterium]|nr:hypothetical protein [Verrucomicrobiae bacterium]
MIPEKITSIEQRAFLRGYQKFEIRSDGDLEVILKRLSSQKQFLEQNESRRIGFAP